MLILGIDPAVTKTGYAVIQFSCQPPRVHACGCITTNSKAQFPLRLKHIYDQLIEIINAHEPDAAVLEETIYAQNVQTAIKMGQARGVVLLAATNSSIPTYEYAPRKIKQSVTGNGAAPKQQVQRMVSQLLKLTEMPASLDISDAMAAAICHHHRSHLQSKGFG